ncbi:MAG: PadR family transcriptional regulator [Rhodoglobus sp.]
MRHSLLAILEQGSCYGFQLRLEFEKRTGSPVNVGQVYSTLDRLERDGLATKDEPDDTGHVYWRITAAGSAVSRSWLAEPIPPATARDELAVKMALALSLPGADAAALVAAQRSMTSAALDAYRLEEPADLARQLVVASLTYAAEAELLWLDRCVELLAIAVPYGLDAAPPKRGRPRALAAG